MGPPVSAKFRCQAQVLTRHKSHRHLPFQHHIIQSTTPRTPMASSTRSNSPITHTHSKNSSFFTRHPRDWSLAEYLSYRHHPCRDPHRILDSWRPALQNIASCRLKCHTDAQRVRASNLLARYNEKGTGSDRLYGRRWLLEHRGKTPAGQTINFAPVFNSDVGSASITLNNSAASAGGDLESSNGPLDDNEDDNEGEDSDEDEDEGDAVPLPPTDPVMSATPSATLIPAIESLTATYKIQTHRWLLSSGRHVETVLYEHCRVMDSPTFAASLAPSFTIDLDDHTVRSWFDDDEWDEIKQSVPPLPMTTPNIVGMFRSLHRFDGCKTPAEIRAVLAGTSFLDPGETYDPDRDFLRMWADLVIRNLLVIWESPWHPLRRTHLEDFYSNLIWAPVLDQCFLSLPSTTIIRKESACHSTASRKNRTRTLETRMRRGRRLDGVIRSIEDESLEFGGMEVARSAAGGITSTKRLGDTQKLLRALRDMLGAMCGLVREEDVPKLQVVGVLCAGLKMRVIRMGCWKSGGVAVVYREGIVGVPVEVEELTELKKTLVMVASMKVVVEQSVKAMRERHQRQNDVAKSDEELMREMMEGPVLGSRLAWAADTPPES